MDISITPFANTLPIHGLALGVGESADLGTAYVDVSNMEVKRVRQRYTRLKHGAEDGLYRYEALESGFTADLLVDTGGLVLDYPGAFRQVYRSTH